MAAPHVTVVWLGIEGDEFVMGHMGVWQKVKNIRRDPRMALSLLGRGKNAMGLPEYLVVYGRARVTERRRRRVVTATGARVHRARRRLSARALP